MKIKFFILAIFAQLMVLSSCSNDDSAALPMTSANTEVVFDYYTVDKTSTDNNSGSVFRTFTTVNLQDQKYFSETREEFINGVSQGQVTNQRYFYENGLLVKRVFEDDIRDFFYDAAGNLSAINWLYHGTPNYYRVVYPSASQIFLEKINLPFNDAGTIQIIRRSIIELDANNNVVSGGNDQDLDGICDLPNTYDYDAENNLTMIHRANGTVIPLAYSPIKDNIAQLGLNTYGKRNLMAYQAECYSYVISNELRQSPFLRDTDTQEAIFEVPSPPYYFRKTATQTTDTGQSTTVTTFYFE